jgi:hypothetical protein
MCNFILRGEAIANQLLKMGKHLYDVFGGVVWKKGLPLAEPGKCMRTGQPLSQNQLNPPGRMPRHMTDEAYLAMINRPDKSRCANCGTYLNQEQIDAAQSQPRELKYHLCDHCFDFESILAAVVHNQPAALALLNQPYPQQPALDYTPQQTVDDVINMVSNNQREYVPAQNMRPLPVANKTFKKNFR